MHNYPPTIDDDEHLEIEDIYTSTISDNEIDNNDENDSNLNKNQK